MQKRTLEICFGKGDVLVNQENTKPRSGQQLLALLEKQQGDLGKSARRLAGFFLDNPGDTALLTSAEVAERCSVHASSVVRLAQGLGFSGYKEMQALFQKDLSASIAGAALLADGNGTPRGEKENLNLLLLADSGRSFNDAASTACRKYCAENPHVSVVTETHVSHTVDPQDFALRIEAAAKDCDGLVLVAREHPAVNGAVRAVTARGVPVICLTTDLPASTRTAYVGSDQYASGSTAGWMCGRLLPRELAGQVLFVYSVPFRCQLDREQGFRQILRTEFPSLTIEEKVSSNESIEITYEAVRRYIVKNGPPAAIYNVSGANLGIGQALEGEGLGQETVFIGHELNENSRSMLERGIMDLAIGHDFDLEIALAVECISDARQGRQPNSHLTQSQLFTRYNCPHL